MPIILCNTPTRDPIRYLSDQLFIDTMALGRKNRADNDFALTRYKVCMSSPVYLHIFDNMEYLICLINDIYSACDPLIPFSRRVYRYCYIHQVIILFLIISYIA